MLQVNTEGQLFRLSEWSASIASHSQNTYVLFMDDYQMDQNHLQLDQTSGEIVKFDFLDSNTPKKLESEEDTFSSGSSTNQSDKENLSRTLFSPKCNIESFLRYFIKLKESSQIFIFPYHLKESKQSFHTWDTVKQVDNIFIDLMSETDKQNIRLSRNVNTFRKTQYNIWNDRPELINFKRCLESEWQPSVHGLKAEDLIVHIYAQENTDKQIMINLFSYTTYQMLDQPQDQLIHDQENYTNAMVLSLTEDSMATNSIKRHITMLNNVQLRAKAESFVVILLDKKKSDSICKLLKFTKMLNQEEFWKFTDELDITNPKETPSVLLNAFFIDEKIILITELRRIILEEDLDEVIEENITFDELKLQSGAKLEKALCANKGYETRDKGNDIVIAFKVNRDEAPLLNYNSKFTQDQNSKGVYSWITRTNYMLDDDEEGLDA